MNFKNGLKFGSQNFGGKCRGLWVVSLLFVVVLVFSPFVSMFNVFSPFASGAPILVVSNETELKNAVNNALTGIPIIVALDNDITLTDTLIISANKDITLTSNKAVGYYKLSGAVNKSTLTVESGGVLKLDGLVITHAKDVRGTGVYIMENGQLVMYNGEISGNIDTFSRSGGGAVQNSGTFEMYNGKIFNNTAAFGGGVLNEVGGSFSMSGGTISNNTVTGDVWSGYGGGVYNLGVFELSGGTISNNTLNDQGYSWSGYGGGVYNSGVFSMSEGEISNNIANGLYSDSGGGVHNTGTFTMLGGTISNNTASVGGGIYNARIGVFELSCGTIFNNTAKGDGGGVYNSGVFSMSEGEISGNKASRDGGGGGVYIGDPFNNFKAVFEMSGGVISNNTAYRGGGVCIYSGYSGSEFNMRGGLIANNTATEDSGGGVCIYSGSFILSGEGVISGNTAAYSGGGVSVSSSGSFVMSGGTISDNTAQYGGGTYNGGVFKLLNGVIANNTANLGGGVYHFCYKIFNFSGGEISNNTATNGGGIYFVWYLDIFVTNPEDYINDFIISSGKISGNRAIGNGGGICVSDVRGLKYVYVSDGVVFSNNRASIVYNLGSAYDEWYNSHIGSAIVWSGSFVQGYNNYDIGYEIYAVTVQEGYASPTGAGNHPVGASVTINAGSRVGYAFSSWVVNTGGVTLSSYTAVTATFTMPGRDVVVTAIWNPTSSGGSGGGGSSGGGGGGSGGSTNKPSPGTPTPSNPVPSETAPPGGGDNVSPSPDDKETSVWSLTMVALIVVAIALVIAVVTSVLLWQKTRKNNSTTKL